ncbi:hypothetical protein VTI74DRAFT_7836 [Chaetomium olivicolor]
MSSQEAPPPPQAHDEPPPPPTESEPLLGRPGDATQQPNTSMFRNLFLGTAWLSQLGAVLLLSTILYSILTHPTLPLVTPHPILQSLGLFTVLQAILLLQPTTTPETKLPAQRGHFALHLLSFSLFAAGTTVIETNKRVNRMPHFHSPHAYLGVATVALLVLQYLFGLTIWAVPRVWGGDARARSMWKYHRWAGYGVLGMLLGTVVAAVETDYVRDVLRVRLWVVLVAEGLIVAGVVPRVHLRKLGIVRP